MSYEYGIKKINERYENIIYYDIKTLKNKYQNAIDILEKTKNIEGCNELKKDLIKKKNDLENKIVEIKDIEKQLKTAAINKDKKEAEEGRQQG